MTWHDVARRQGGAIGHDQLLLAGVTAATMRHLTSTGELVRYCRGVYVAGAAPLTFRARVWASVLATGGLAGYQTAGRLWGVSTDPCDTIHVVLPHSRRVVAPPRTVLHRVPVPIWARCLHAELPMTTKAWTVIDLVATLPSSAAMQLADRGVQRGWFTATQLDRRLREQPCRTGNKQLRLIGSHLGDGAAAQSERILHGLLRRAGLRGWRANHPVWSDGELVGVVDVALLALRVAIEVDGMAFHVDPARFQHDRTRQNDLVALGWTVIRFTWADLTERPGYVVAVLRRFGRVEVA